MLLKMLYGHDVTNIITNGLHSWQTSFSSHTPTLGPGLGTALGNVARFIQTPFAFPQSSSDIFVEEESSNLLYIYHTLLSIRRPCG